MAVVCNFQCIPYQCRERISQFGTLKCNVGATGRQIIKSVLYESIFIRAWHTDWNPCRTLPDKEAA